MQRRKEEETEREKELAGEIGVGRRIGGNGALRCREGRRNGHMVGLG
jgi:hypothetical protein